MTNTYFAIALVSAHSVGVTMRAENIAMAFAGAKDYLQRRHPRSDVIVQAVQRITNEFTAPVTPSQVITTRNYA